MRTTEQIIQSEVHYCVSYLVSTLSGGYGNIAMDGYSKHGASTASALSEMFEQAYELAAPIADYEEAAIQAGWSHAPEFGTQNAYRDSTDGQTWACADWRELCEEFEIEPYEREVFEHWIVSDWLADKLEAKGEKVDRDFAGMIVWARTTTGQAISMDSVIEAIRADLVREYGE